MGTSFAQREVCAGFVAHRKRLFRHEAWGIAAASSIAWRWYGRRRFLVAGGGGGDFSRRQRSKEEEAQNDDDDDEEEIFLQHRRREQKKQNQRDDGEALSRALSSRGHF